ncbi:hypothetical protein VHAB30_51810 [Variovorax boronicumulans]|nr:hypothetical protein VHAB30_51810 [Variovorax boronicumulans]
MPLLSVKMRMPSATLARMRWAALKEVWPALVSWMCAPVCACRWQVRGGGGGDACRTGEREMRCGQFGKAAFGRWAAVAPEVFVLLLDGMGDGGLVVVVVLSLGCAGRFGQAFDLVACARQALDGFAHVLGLASCIGTAFSGDEHAVLGSQYAMGVSAQLEALPPGVFPARVVLDARDRPQAQA